MKRTKGRAEIRAIPGLEPSSRIVISRKAIWRIVGNEAVIIHEDSSRYYALNPLGSEIWKMFSLRKNVGEIIDMIVEKYAVKRSVVTKDLNKLYRELLQAGLVKNS